MSRLDHVPSLIPVPKFILSYRSLRRTGGYILSGSPLLDQALSLRKVRRTKNILLGVTALAMVIVIIISMSHKGMSGSPLFIPIPAIILIVMLSAMLMNFISIAFNGVEITTADTSGQRFRSAQHGRNVSQWTGVLCIVLVVVFFLIIPYVETEISTDRVETLDTGTIKEHEWFTVDDFDLSYTSELVLKVVDGAPIDYTIRVKNPNTGKFEDKLSGQVQEGDALELDLTDWPLGDYLTVFWTDGTPQTDESSYDYQVNRLLNPDLSLALTGILGVIAISSIIWAVVAHVLMKRFEIQSVGGLATSFDESY